MTANAAELLASYEVVTTSGKVPSDNSLGTWTTIVVGFQDETVAVLPPNVTALAVDPKLAPLMVITDPIGPDGTR